MGSSRLNDPFRSLLNLFPLNCGWYRVWKDVPACVQAFSHLLHGATSIASCNECLKDLVCWLSCIRRMMGD